jgi:hypothetical protein
MSYCDPNDPCEKCRADKVTVEYCRCSPRKRIEKTDGQSRLMCGRCNRLIDVMKQQEADKSLPAVIQRLRKYKAVTR